MTPTIDDAAAFRSHGFRDVHSSPLRLMFRYADAISRHYAFDIDIFATPLISSLSLSHDFLRKMRGFS
jgi:hypothetical protein